MNNTIKQPRMKFNKDTLIKYCKDNHIELIGDYDTVTMNTRIIAKCGYDECENNMVEKSFTSLVKYKNYGCNTHKNITMQIKKKASIIANGSKTRPVKYNKEFLLQFCEDNHIKLLQEYDKVNWKTKIVAKCIQDGCNNNMVEKGFYTFVNSDYYECEEHFRIIVNAKTIAGNLIKYGSEYYHTSIEGKQKIAEIVELKYGGNPFGNDEIKLKILATFAEKYGGNPFQNELVKDKIKATNMIIYGVPFAIQNAEVFQKASDNAFKHKKYIYPSGKFVYVQGYEPKALDDLIFKYNIHEDELVTDRTKVPEIWWYDENNIKHRYYVDILISSQQRCIEVKSTWTLKKGGPDVFLKQQAVKDSGYECEIWVYDEKKLVEKIL